MNSNQSSTDKQQTLEEAKEEFKTQIFMALGEASMCWNPRPDKQVFDSSMTLKIGNRIVSSLDSLLALAATAQQAKGVDVEELWDKHSEIIDDNIDSLQMFAGKCVITKAQFVKALQELYSATKTREVNENFLKRFGRIIWYNCGKMNTKEIDSFLNTEVPKYIDSQY